MRVGQRDQVPWSQMLAGGHRERGPSLGKHAHPDHAHRGQQRRYRPRVAEVGREVEHVENEIGEPDPGPHPQDNGQDQHRLAPQLGHGPAQ